MVVDWWERRAIAARIRDLKASVEELNRRNQRYHVVLDPPRTQQNDPLRVRRRRRGRRAAAAAAPYHDVPSDAMLTFQDWDIIGRSSDKEELIKKLMSGGDGQLGVVSVWGMGGMGKSSLVSMVCNDPELLDACDYGAWVTVPHPLDNTDEFMRQLWKGFGHREGEPAQDKGYMIVVDDLQTKEEWDQIWPKLSSFEKTKGSRVIVTTRRVDVARYCAESVQEKHRHVYELKPLGDEESMTLLCRKVNPLNCTDFFLCQSRF